MAMPENLCKRRLHNFLLAEEAGELGHVFQIADRVAGGVGVCQSDVPGEVVDKFAAPRLARVDLRSNLMIEKD